MSYTLTVHPVDNLSLPGTTYDYYVDPDKIIFTNLRGVSAGTGWEFRANQPRIEGGVKKDIANCYGFVARFGTTTELELVSDLIFQFQDAVQNTSTGTKLDFVVKLTKVVVNASNASNADYTIKDRWIDVCDFNGGYLWVNGYSGTRGDDTFNASNVITSDPNWRRAVKTDILMYVADSIGNIQSGTFAFPFMDIDSIETPVKQTNNTYSQSKGPYAESIVIHEGCPNVYVLKNTYLTWTGRGDWNPSAAQPTQTVTGQSIRFMNGGTNQTTSTNQDYTGIVGIFNSAAYPATAHIQFIGCDCGTLFADRSLGKYTISYNANGGDNAPAAQYKIQGQNITLSNQKPTQNTKIRWEGNGGNFSGATFTETAVPLDFLGWATTKAKADASIIDYPKDVVNIYTADASVTLYAVWGPGEVGQSRPNPSRDSNYRLQGGADDKVHNWTTSQNGSTYVPDDLKVPVAGITLFAKWQYAVIVDPDGDPNGHGKILVNGSWTESTQVTWKTYDVRVTLSGMKFKKTGSNYLGLATSASATSPTVQQPVHYDGNTPITYYAVWGAKTYTVRFRDGFTSRSGGKDIITRVEVDYGSSVPASQVPVVGVKYPAPYQGNGGFFKKEGYTFAGWSGSYTNVKSNRDIVAMWSFSPIWVTKNSIWNSYEPDKVTISPYTVNNLVVHGTVADATSAGYTSPTGQDMSHSGQPPLCMKLVVENFKRNYDMSVSCDITTAALRAFPAHTPPMTYDRPLMVSACIINGNISSVADAKTKFGTLDRYSETELFSKNTASTWADQSIKLTNPVTLSAPAPDSGQNAYLFICMSTDCDDTDSDETVPVYYYNLSTKVPAKPPGYFYRLENGSWVLRRPFYVCKKRTYKENNVTHTELCWCSCEDLSTPVYGADGHKINHDS